MKWVTMQKRCLLHDTGLDSRSTDMKLVEVPGAHEPGPIVKKSTGYDFR